MILSSVTARAIQIIMTLAAAQPSDTQKTTDDGLDLGIPIVLVAAWVMDVNTDPGYSRTIGPDMAVGSSQGRMST